MHHRFGIISLALISALVSCSRTPGMQEIETRFSGQPQTFCAVTVADEMMRSRYIRYPAQAFLI